VHGGRVMGTARFCGLSCISTIVVEGACVRDCRGMGLCTFGTVG
jgi:hypothetical protein